MNDSFNVKIKNFVVNYYDYNEIVDICKIVMKNIIDMGYDLGIYKLEVYINYNYGMIIDGRKILKTNDGYDIKICFHIDSIFLEEILDIEDFDENVIYYNNKFYINYNSNHFFDSYILYGDEVNNILNKGVIINC